MPHSFHSRSLMSGFTHAYWIGCLLMLYVMLVCTMRMAWCTVECDPNYFSLYKLNRLQRCISTYLLVSIGLVLMFLLKKYYTIEYSGRFYLCLSYWRRFIFIFLWLSSYCFQFALAFLSGHSYSQQWSHTCANEAIQIVPVHISD